MSLTPKTTNNGCLKIIGYILFVLFVLSTIATLVDQVKSAQRRKAARQAVSP